MPILLTRDRLLAEWSSSPFMLDFTYATRTLAVRERTGAPAYWEAGYAVGDSKDERDKAAQSGVAMPDGSYPIDTCDGTNSVSTAISAVGRGGADHDTIRAHIMKRADSLGCSSLIPDNWNADGSLAADGSASAQATLDALRTAVATATTPEQIADAFAPVLAELAAYVTAPPAPGQPDDTKPPAADAAPPAPADGKPSPEAADAAVTQAIATLDAAAKAAVKAQQSDPDNTDDPLDAKVLAGLEQVASIVSGVIKDQQTDSDANTTKKPAASSAPPAAASPPAPVAAAALAALAAPVSGTTPGNSAGIPGDGDDSPVAPGDIENDVICANPDCGHLASAHQDTTDGANQGTCNMVNCSCPGMVPEADFVNPTGEDGGGPDNAGGGGEEAAPPAPQAAHAALADDAAPPANAPNSPPAPASLAPGSGDQLPEPNPAPSLVMGPAFCIPVGIIEDKPTGDGRNIAPGALISRACPLPLMGLKTSTHDPNGFDQNDPAVWIGVIESCERRTDDEGVWQAAGHMFANDDASDFVDIIAGMGRAGVSADVGEAEVDSVLDGLLPELPPGLDVIMEDEAAPGLEMPPVLDTLTKGTLLGFTVVPVPAFDECFIVLGDGSELPPIGELVDRSAAPAPATPPGVVPVTASGWRLVEDDCEPCATSVPVLASAGPVAPPRAWFEDPSFARGDVRLRETVDNKTGRLTGKYACPTTITEAGEVYGHLAQWGVCHTSPAYRGRCMLAPRNRSGYAYWYSGGQVLTAEGDLVEVGPLTAGTGHANPRDDIFAALAHYDNTGTAVAQVAVGEDEFGIWFHGALTPTATPEQIYTLRASNISGDWRPIGNRHELVAGLAVNRGGFPQARAHRVGGRVTSLVAAGAPTFLSDLAPRELTFEERLSAMERSVTPMLPLAKAQLEDRMASLRAG